MRASNECITSIKQWEEFVGYPYDDKIPKRRIDGVLQYPEWTGGEIRGTITLGYGHTDAAGAPKIEAGMHCTEEMACTILRGDIAKVEAQVNRAIKVPISQHEYDALVSLAYNCGSALPKVAVLINSGRGDEVPAKMLEFVYSKGERMKGLVNRRNAEIALWNRPDDPQIAEVDETFSPKAEREPPPKDARSSKSIAAGSTVTVAGAMATIDTANQAAESIKTAGGNLQDFGLFDIVGIAAHKPMFWVGIVIVACAAFLIWDRYRKLVQDHV